MGCLQSRHAAASEASALSGEVAIDVTDAGKVEVEAADGAPASDGGDADVKKWNDALVFIKPHASNAKVKELVEKYFAQRGVEILDEGTLDGPEIDEKGIIDEHYAHIAKIALYKAPKDLPVSKEKLALFEETFGVSWASALEKIINLGEFEARFPEMSHEKIHDIWMDEIKRIKLAPGTYVGYFPEQDVYVMNAFYGSMRSVYTHEASSVVYFHIRFSERDLSWSEFRSEVIGATDPAKAHPKSLRASIYANYKALGLEKVPDLGENGVHASAGPVEGLRERMVWLGRTLEDDHFGKALVDAGVDRATIDLWLANEIVTIEGETDHAFDLLEDKDSTKVIELALAHGSA